jgi:hypothetical protein
MDTRPRNLSSEERETLGQLAAVVVSFLKQYESEAGRRAAEAKQHFGDWATDADFVRD